MNTNEGGEKEVKEVKITISEPFAAEYVDKNILLVTPVKWESAVWESLIPSTLFVYSGASED